MIPNNEYEYAKLLYNIDLFATCVSLIGSGWMIISCLRIPSPKSISLKLITALAIADFFFTVSNVLSNFETYETFELCMAEAVLRQVSLNFTIYFSTYIAIVSYRSSKYETPTSSNCYFLRIMLIGVLFTILQISSSQIMEWFDLEDVIVVAYGPFFCWFSYSVEATDLWKLAVTMIYQGIPTILGVFITIISYNLVIKQIKEVPKEILEVMNVDVYRLYWYPAVFIITFVPSLIDKIVRIYIEDRPVIFEAAHLLLTHSIGFNNALVYGIQRKLHTMHNNVYIHSKVTSFVDMNNRESILSYDGD